MKKLALIQIVLGILVVGSLIFWAGWVSTGYHIHEGNIPGSDIVVHCMALLLPNPLLNAWIVVYIILGLAVLGCGILQYFEARRQKAGEVSEGVNGTVPR